MSPALLEAPPRLRGDGVTSTIGGRRVTLEERLEAAWRSARRDGATACPVCDAAMRPMSRCTAAERSVATA